MKTQNGNHKSNRKHYSSSWELDIPDAQNRRQGQEVFYLNHRSDPKKLRYTFHDYGEIYKYPGLYEEIFYNRLKCNSPSVLAAMFRDFAQSHSVDLSGLKVLDFGAGNGIMGRHMSDLGVSHLHAVDIIPAAKQAAMRDNPDVYDNYTVSDLSSAAPARDADFYPQGFNCLTCVAALGFNDIPPIAFLRAMDYLEAPGWVIFNLRTDFFKAQDETGFRETIEDLIEGEYLEILCETTYRHRLSADGNDLNYLGLIAKKAKPFSEDLLDDSARETEEVIHEQRQ